MQEHPPFPTGPGRRRIVATRRIAVRLDDPRAMQILSTEHWSLLATRSLSWSESFARAGLFLSVVSATVVALALVGRRVPSDRSSSRSRSSCCPSPCSSGSRRSPGSTR